MNKPELGPSNLSVIHPSCVLSQSLAQVRPSRSALTGASHSPRAPRSPLVSCLNTTPEIRPRYNLDRLVGRYSRNWSVLSLVQWPFLRNFSDQLNGGRVKTSLLLFFGQILLRVLSTAMDELVASLMPLAREARDKRAQRRGRLVARQAR